MATAGPAFLWKLASFERYPLGFFIGCGLWHVALFVIGFAGFYTWPVMATLTIIAAALSIPHMATCVRAAQNSSWRIHFSPDLAHMASIVLGIGLVCVVVTFVLIRGMYPLGGHDYYMHYFHYLTDVVQRRLSEAERSLVPLLR